MNSVTKFFHELFNPHCQHCADERREQREEKKYCASCETLALENARLVRDNERLLDSLLEKPVIEGKEPKIDIGNLKPIQIGRTPYVSSRVRRETLENESRHTANLAKDAPKPDINKDFELKELEAELDDVRTNREKEKVVNS